MSSSESEDENLKKFAESVDVTVFSDGLYNKEKAEVKETKIEMKSQRVLAEEETIFQSEINVSKTMQEFIGKKLSKLIDEQVEFVEVTEKKKKERDPVDNMRLLSGTKETVKYIDEPSFIDTREKVPIKRRKIEGETEVKESAKIEKASIDPAAIESEVKSWDKKQRHPPTEYKNLKNIGYLREPTNEFTKARNKNGWGESKIKTGKFHNPPISESIKK
jgi:hypothetical protein